MPYLAPSSTCRSPAADGTRLESLRCERPADPASRKADFSATFDCKHQIAPSIQLLYLYLLSLAVLMKKHMGGHSLISSLAQQS